MATECRGWWVLVLAAGCGRIGFDPAERPAGDGALDVGTTDAACVLGPWGPATPITELNTSAEEDDVTVTADELTVVFESNRVGSMARALWMSTRGSTSALWGMPVVIGALDTSADEEGPDLGADGLLLVYTSLVTGPSDLYAAARATTTDAFASLGGLGIAGDPNPPHYSPELAADGLQLYYAHDLDLAFGTRLAGNMPFSFQRLLDEVNEPATDGNPTVSADGLELYFQSYRLGFGAIFRATRASPSDPFGAPVQSPELLPTAAAEVGSPELSADGRTIYYYAQVGAQNDLYRATRSCQ